MRYVVKLLCKSIKKYYPVEVDALNSHISKTYLLLSGRRINVAKLHKVLFKVILVFQFIGIFSHNTDIIDRYRVAKLEIDKSQNFSQKKACFYIIN